MTLQQYMKENKFFTLNEIELKNLLANKQLMPVVRKRLQDAYDIKYCVYNTKQTIAEQTITEARMILLIHQGICPECLRHAYCTIEKLVPGKNWYGKNPYDHERITVECIEGHKHVAEPNELGTDWVAW